MKEIAKGKAEGLFPKHDLDMKFGKNRWRASKRFLLWQESHQQYRAIDNCKSSSANLSSFISESIITPAYDTAMRMVVRMASLLDCDICQLWQLSLGCEDMEDAY
eukprot:552604-Karenia_brevis.AAC.1